MPHTVATVVAPSHLNRYEDVPLRMAKDEFNFIEVRPSRKHLARFFKKVHVVQSGCWEWLGGKNADGYGLAWWAQRRLNTSAHRISYAWFVREPTSSEVVDHLCRNHGCVNPAHLEAVPQAVNVKRGLSGVERNTCKRGHPMTPGNVGVQTNYGERFRVCLICRAARETTRRMKRRGMAR